MKEPIIEFEDFTFRYKVQTEPTLKHINLTIYKGEKILILGPSGSGKSTLSSCINGLIPHAFEGEITGACRVAGRDIKKTNMVEFSKTVGTVLQDSDAQFVSLSVGEEIAFSLENRNVPRETMIPMVQKAAGIVNMEDLLAELPYDLSGGQKQKVALAGVLHEDVDILLFDEPLASLDPQMGMTAIDLIDRVHSDLGATIIIIEHRLEDVLYRPVDRIVLVDDGEIVTVGTPDEILASTVLREHGIREPLYLSALKDIGGALQSDENLCNLDKIDLSPYRAQLSDFLTRSNAQTSRVKGEKLIEVNHMSFSYGSKAILSELNFTVCEGERIALIGENGAGKSTLAKLLCGAERPQKGKILVQGGDYLLLSIKELAERIGFVMQDPNQMLVKDIVLEEVSLALKLRSFKDEEVKARAEQVLKLTGLYSMRNWPVGALSYGQRKRVTIASMLVLRPKCLVLDEPTAGQDYQHYTEIMEFVDALNREMNMAVIFITHDMHLALEYTDRAIVLSKGHCIGDGNIYEILSNEKLIEQASLKKTSILRLAQKLGLDPVAFSARFVSYEEERRQHG